MFQLLYTLTQGENDKWNAEHKYTGLSCSSEIIIIIGHSFKMACKSCHPNIWNARNTLIWWKMKSKYFETHAIKIYGFISLGRKESKGAEKEWPMFPEEIAERDKDLLE